jgi:methionyl-tRNA synthetase
MNDEPRYLVTSALPYANGSNHIGQIAGAYLPADIYVRYLRLMKRDVLFICGSDEHGVPITISADKEGVTPQAIADKYHALMKSNFEGLGISFDTFSRTSSEKHKQVAQDFFTTLYNKGVFIEQESEQFFDTEKNQFLADRYIVGTCPNCANEKAYGDQCEKCGSTLSPEELINPRSGLSDSVPIKKKTTNWYLPLDQYQTKLEEYIASHPEWKTNIIGQCKSWLSQGLLPRAMTRDMAWGVPVPLKNAEGKVLYVWFDAPIGYITATQEITSDWEKYWKDKNSRLIHFLGKDNIVFHCIIFPAMLMAHGDYVLPYNVPGNEFLNIESEKISTSRNWAVWVHDFLKEFPNQQDVLRYTLCSIMPETKDNNFTWSDFQLKNNSELVGILGNLVNRVIVLIHKYYDGIVPTTKGCDELLQVCAEAGQKTGASIEQFRFREAQAEMMNLARHGNKLLTDKEPWKLHKTDPEATAVVLYDCLQIIANLSILCEPFLPFTAAKIRKLLNIEADALTWTDIGKQDLVKPGVKLNEATLLFSKIEDNQIKYQTDRLEAIKINMQSTNNSSKASAEVEKEQVAKPNISYDEFAKMDIQIGTIIEASKVEKADKLLKLRIDLGYEQRTVVSGIALHFSPEEIIGKQVSILVNLEPRKIRGEESKGMILMAEDKSGKLHFVSPTGIIDNGSEVR